MANADFSQKQNSTSGGFDAGSYREQKQPEQAVPLKMCIRDSHDPHRG